MQVKTQLLDCIHLDPGYALLSVQNCITCLELFRMMDIHNNASLNDYQFQQFLRAITDLDRQQADTLFEILDIDQSGELEFEEFYLVFCIVVACKDQYEKEFIYRHSKNIFRLIDADASGLISGPEFQQMGVLFNFDYNSIHSIFDEFDVSGDKSLDFMEFRLFTMACIDEQRCADTLIRVRVLTDYHFRILRTMEFLIRMYTITQKLPRPTDTDLAIRKVPDPFLPDRKRRFGFIDWSFIKAKFTGHGVLIHRVKVLKNWLYKVLRILCCCFCCCILWSKLKFAVRDSAGWKCCRKLRRQRHQRLTRRANLPDNLYRSIKIQRKKLKEAEIKQRRKAEREENRKRKFFWKLKKRFTQSREAGDSQMDPAGVEGKELSPPVGEPSSKAEAFGLGDLKQEEKVGQDQSSEMI